MAKARWGGPEWRARIDRQAADMRRRNAERTGSLPACVRTGAICPECSSPLGSWRAGHRLSPRLGIRRRRWRCRGCGICFIFDPRKLERPVGEYSWAASALAPLAPLIDPRERDLWMVYWAEIRRWPVPRSLRLPALS